MKPVSFSERRRLERWRRTCSLLLAFCLAAGPMALAACNKQPAPAPDSSVPTTEEPNLPPPEGNEEMKEIKYLDLADKPVLAANFAEDLNESAQASVYRLPAEEGIRPEATLAVLWNSSGMRVMLTYDSADSISLRAGSCDQTLAADPSGQTSLVLSWEQLGCTLGDLGQYVPLEVRVAAEEAAAEFAGFAQLRNDTALFAHDASQLAPMTSEVGITGSPGSSMLGVDAGAKATDGMIQLYDRYSAARNPAFVHNRLISPALDEMENAGRPWRFACDINIESMPVYQPTFTTAVATYGLSFVLNAGGSTGGAFFGLIHTENGLFFFVNNGSALSTALVSRPFGVTFRLEVLWETDNSLTLSIDGRQIHRFSNVAAARTGFADHTLTVVWQRNSAPASSPEDNFSVYLDNLSLVQENTSSLTDLVEISDLFGKFAVVQAEAEDVYIAPSSLTLRSEVTSRRFGITSRVYWKSSNPDIITDGGAVTSPTNAGEFVTMTMYLFGGDYVASSKTFRFFVKATAPTQHVLSVRRDTDPYTGSGTAADTCMTLTDVNNSVVYDMGSTTDIGGAVIHGLEGSTVFLSKSFVALYASEDNRTYRRINDFTMLQSGSDIYFYNFHVQARYLKVHCVDVKNTEGTILNSLQKMMSAAASAEELFGDAEFRSSRLVSLSNPAEADAVDRVYPLTLDELGIPGEELNADRSDIRFYLDDRLLPHYYHAGTFYVRVDRIPAGGTVSVRVQYGSETALSVANGNETFEVQYGSKIPTQHTGAWRNSVAQMPDGSLLMAGGRGSGGLSCERSLDGGHTWQPSVAIPGTDDILDGGGFIVDKESNLVFYIGYANDSNAWTCRLYIISSRDSGYTWSAPVTVPDQPRYALTYSDGLKLSTADGDGPGVDYVMSLAASENQSTMEFFATAIYSCDGGKSWKTSKSRIRYDGGGSSASFEGGVSEETIYEQADGTLVLWARCQIASVVHFAISHSYDHGVTWEESATLSNIYTSNTQPIIEDYNGTPVLLWGGNNALGGTSYMRFPLNLAYSTDDGESFTGIQDLLFQTPYADLNNTYRITNPDLTFFTYNGTDCVFIITPSYRLLIEDVGRFLTETKGAFDSFETGSPAAEGWLSIAGSATRTETGATDGSYAMRVGSGISLSRSLPALREGTLSFDLWVESLGQGADIELQTAFHNRTGKAAPVSLSIDRDGRLYTVRNGVRTDTGLALSEGQNTLSLTLTGTETAALQVNGKTAFVRFDAAVGDTVCFFNIWNHTDTVYCIDRFVVMSGG